MTIKILLLCSFLVYWTKGDGQEFKTHYWKVNTCDFTLKNKVDRLRELTILRYQIVNNENKDKKLLCQYFLMTDGKDIFNVISIFDEVSNDSYIKENKYSKNWVFKKIIIDSCLVFYSQVDLEKQIDKKYPILAGRIYGELD